MLVLFCADPINRKNPDGCYNDEALAVQQCSIDSALLNFEALVHQKDIDQALKGIKPSKQEIVVYRGWMLKPVDYLALYDGLKERGLILVNSPNQYKHCHYLPSSYHLIDGYTPKSIWYPISGFSEEQFNEIDNFFGNKPILVKDYVKSQKHYWNEACFIPCASDKEQLGRIIKRFLDLQGDDLNEGLVFREFVELESLGIHPKSGMPINNEHRLFFLNGKLISQAEYWEEGNYQQCEIPIDHFSTIAKKIQSNFFSMDVARTKTGNWIIVELGDGQVAGLPINVNELNFYERVKIALESSNN